MTNLFKPNTRRHFLKVGGALASAAAVETLLPRTLKSQSPEALYHAPISDPDIKAIAHKALDAAKSAGATYADVRLTRLRGRQLGFSFGVDEIGKHYIGIRTLVNGYWGFAAASTWDDETAARLGKRAVELSKANALGKTRILELAPIARIDNEHWENPIEIDPFQLDIAEVLDMMKGMRTSFNKAKRTHLSDTRVLTGTLKDLVSFTRQENAFGSTDGSYGTQTLRHASGKFEQSGILGDGSFRLDFLSPAAVGWELWKGRNIHEDIEQAFLRLNENLKLPVNPIEVGRYDVLLNAESVARFAGPTLGLATEFDRAVGDEANASGTSYLNAPFDMVGSFKVGSSALRVTANRSQPRAVGTVGWDDEGVRPKDFVLIDQGIVQTFQTTRDNAAVLKQGTTHRAVSGESTGCAHSATANEEPIAKTANIVLEASSGTDVGGAAIEDVKRGILFENMNVMPDFQQLSGVAVGQAFEIRDGKKFAVLVGTGILFRTPEFWKSLSAIGPAASTRSFGMEYIKGQPRQLMLYTVTTPSMLFKETTVIDVTRKS